MVSTIRLRPLQHISLTRTFQPKKKKSTPKAIARRLTSRAEWYDSNAPVSNPRTTMLIYRVETLLRIWRRKLCMPNFTHTYRVRTNNSRAKRSSISLPLSSRPLQVPMQPTLQRPRSASFSPRRTTPGPMFNTTPSCS